MVPLLSHDVTKNLTGHRMHSTYRVPEYLKLSLRPTTFRGPENFFSSMKDASVLIIHYFKMKIGYLVGWSKSIILYTTSA